MMRFVLALALCLAVTPLAPAQRQPGDPIKLMVEPAKAPPRPLKYAFQFEMIALKTGNAADDYKAAAKLYKDARGSEGSAYETQFDGWNDCELKDFPIKEVEAFFTANKGIMPLLESASRREQCDWGHREKLRKQGFSLAIPEIQEMRYLIRLVAVHTRLNLARGQMTESLQDVRLGLAMARHTNESPILISSLVAIALTQVMLNRVDEIIQQPGAPNLYSALSDLPTPCIPLRKAIEGERMGVFGSFPGMADAVSDPNAAPLTEQQVQDCIKLMEEFEPVFKQVGVKEAIALNVSLKHEKAKKALIDAGRSKDKVDAMPHFEVALLHSFLSVDRYYDDLATMQNCPPWEAYVRSQQFAVRVKELAAKGEPDGPALPLARYILPAVEKIMRGQIRVERHLAALRCVEALRLYAAAHDGKLPARLADVKEATIPVDPLTGKPFEYEVIDKTAVLKGIVLPEEKDRRNEWLTYEVTIRK